MSGSCRRIERIALLTGAFELAFFVVAWQAGPSFGRIAKKVVDQPLVHPHGGVLVAARPGCRLTGRPFQVRMAHCAL